jgi:hypothetical protein
VWCNFATIFINNLLKNEIRISECEIAPSRCSRRTGFFSNSECSEGFSMREINEQGRFWMGEFEWFFSA